MSMTSSSVGSGCGPTYYPAENIAELPIGFGAIDDSNRPEGQFSVLHFEVEVVTSMRFSALRASAGKVTWPPRSIRTRAIIMFSC